MYQIKCDDYVLYDHRDEDLVVLNPKCKLKVNGVGEGSFTIFSNHPYYGELKKLRSIFEFRQDNHILFRGRMTQDSRDFYHQTQVDLEGVLAFANDSIIPPFNFPGDFPDAADATNVVEYFLGWVLDQHNVQVEDWQKLKLGNVTVADPNNVITRSSNTYMSTWEVLKTKLFESSLGGYLCIRYEDDGNYVDYVDRFTLTNTQRITFGENLLDMVNETDASETYSAILPLGVKVEDIPLTLESLTDGDLTDDLVKKGRFIYSKSGVEQCGWKCVPVEDSTWEDVTLVTNLQTRGMEYLSGTAMKLSNTITVKAVDLHFTDDQIESLRIYRNILVDSPVHGVVDATYQLTELDIDILNPQNTVITAGDTVRTLVDVQGKQQVDNIERVEKVAELVETTTAEAMGTVHQQMVLLETSVISRSSELILGALEQYVKTGDYDEYKNTVTSQLEIMAEAITMNFTTTTENIKNVAGDLQAEITQRQKHIKFSENGITISAGENAMTLELDNNMIRFKKNGVQFGWWDGVDFHTGNIMVNVDERAQFGNFAFVPRSDGSLMFLKVGG